MAFHSESGPGDTHGIHYWRYANTTDRDNHVPSEGPTDAITADDVAQKRICYVDSTQGYYHLTNHSPVTWVSVGEAVLSDHSARHESGGSDEISIAGLGGEAADPQPPKSHAASHQDGGSDEISIAGLSGQAADPQSPLAHQLDPSGGVHTGTLPEGSVVFGGTGHAHGGGADGAQVDYGDLLNVPSTFAPSAHASSHQNGGGDEINVGGLSGELADPQPVKAHALDPTGGDHTGTLAESNVVFGPSGHSHSGGAEGAVIDHADLSNVTADQHHARLHALDSASDHSGSLPEGDVTFDDSTGHAHTGAGGSGSKVAHGDLSGVSADQHHAEVHALDPAGGKHTGSLPEGSVTFSGTGHGHSGGADGKQVDYGDLLNVPSSFPPSSHALGGAAHAADSLANLNSKITGGKTLVAKEDANTWSRKQTVTAAAGEEAVEGTGGGNAAGNAYAAFKGTGGASTGSNGDGGAGFEGVGGTPNGTGIPGPGVRGTGSTGGILGGIGVEGRAPGTTTLAFFTNIGIGVHGTGLGAGSGGYCATGGQSAMFGLFDAGANGAIFAPTTLVGFGSTLGGTAVIGIGGDNSGGDGGRGGDFSGGDALSGNDAGGLAVRGAGGDGFGTGAGGQGGYFLGGTGGGTGGEGGHAVFAAAGAGGAGSGTGGRGLWFIGGAGGSPNGHGGPGMVGDGGNSKGSGNAGMGAWAIGGRNEAGGSGICGDGIQGQGGDSNTTATASGGRGGSFQAGWPNADGFHSTARHEGAGGKAWGGDLGGDGLQGSGGTAVRTVAADGSDEIKGTAPNMSIKLANLHAYAGLVGKDVEITSATTGGNNGTFTITSIVAVDEVAYTNASGAAEAFPGQAYLVNTEGGRGGVFSGGAGTRQNKLGGKGLESFGGVGHGTAAGGVGVRMVGGLGGTTSGAGGIGGLGEGGQAGSGSNADGGIGLRGVGGIADGSGTGGDGVVGDSAGRGGHGVRAIGDTGGSPNKSALRIDPQSADPGSASHGDVIVKSGKMRLHDGSSFYDLGDVAGPASATDNAIARFDAATGKLLQNSSAEIDDNGELKIKLYSQAAEPALNADEFAAFWKDTDDSNRIYLVFRRGSADQVKVELT